ncbi:MAG: TFIIB-type zinc ribbon-containing protein, partial [Candidatus Zixiibacteriota bacterium]
MRCPSCSGTAVLHDHNRGEQVCTRCGLVIFEKLLEPGPEWRSSPEKPSGRADVSSGLDVTRHDLGLGSGFDVSREFSPLQRAKLRRMKALHERSRVRGWEDRSLRDALVELGKICGDLSLPKGVRAEASVNYRRAKVKGVVFGKEMSQVLGAVVLLTCRARGLPRGAAEGAKSISSRYKIQTQVALRSINRIVAVLRRELGVQEQKISALDYLNRFAPKFKLSGEALGRAHEMFTKLPRSFRAKPPLFLAAVLVYSAAREVGDDITLQKVAREMKVGMSSLSQNAARVKE